MFFLFVLLILGFILVDFHIKMRKYQMKCILNRIKEMKEEYEKKQEKKNERKKDK